MFSENSLLLTEKQAVLNDLSYSCLSMPVGTFGIFIRLLYKICDPDDDYRTRTKPQEILPKTTLAATVKNGHPSFTDIAICSGVIGSSRNHLPVAR